jgi:DNA primase
VEVSEEKEEGKEVVSQPPKLVVVPQVLTHKEKNILNLLQVVVRHGECIVYQWPDGRTVSAGEYIINELRKDNIEIENSLYKQILDEFSNNYSEGFVATTFFQHHPDPEINQFAVQMIADKYQLSRIYSRQSISENVVQEVERDEREFLPELIQRLLLELKYTIVNERIDALQKMLKEAQERGDWQLQTVILEQQPQLHDIRSQLCKALGNRVIV